LIKTAQPITEVYDEVFAAIEGSKEKIFYIVDSIYHDKERLINALDRLKIDAAILQQKIERQGNIKSRAGEITGEMCNALPSTDLACMKAEMKSREARLKLQVLQAQLESYALQREVLERALVQARMTDSQAVKAISLLNTVANLLQNQFSGQALVRAPDEYDTNAMQIIQAQEDERVKIARDIHDGPAQSIANIKVRLGIVSKLIDKDLQMAQNEIADLQSILQSSIRDMRRMIFQLRPVVLETGNVVLSVQNYLQIYKKNYGLTCSLQVEGPEQKLDAATETVVLRVIQESLNNIAKHTDANKAFIVMRFDENELTTQVQDYGKGFNAKNAISDSKDHYGLIGMSERVRLLGGQFSIKSSKNQGTLIEFTLSTLKEMG
jgi:two-component system sensor histidine kinase DegS